VKEIRSFLFPFLFRHARFVRKTFRSILQLASSRSCAFSISCSRINHTPRDFGDSEGRQESGNRESSFRTTSCDTNTRVRVRCYMSVATSTERRHFAESGNRITRARPKHATRSHVQEGRVRLFLREIVVRIRLHSPKFLELTRDKKKK